MNNKTKSLIPLLCGVVLTMSIPWAQSAPSVDHNQLLAKAKVSCAPYAGRKLSLVVPYKPGGGYDLMARALGPVLAAHSGMQVSVSNIPGGKSILALRAIVNGNADKPVLGLIGLGVSANAMIATKAGLALSDLRGLGVMSVEKQFWVTKTAIDWKQTSGMPLLTATSTDPLLYFGLPSQAMNLKARAVLGYQGTNDTWLALLRGEVDVINLPEETASRNLAAGVDAKVRLILSNKSDPKHPGVPYLAGPGGMVDTRTQDMAAPDRQRLMAMGELAAMLSELTRTLVASARLDGKVLTCLRHATEAAIFDPYLAEVAKRQKFGLEPETAADAQRKIDKMAQLLQENNKVLRAIAAQWKEGH